MLWHWFSYRRRDRSRPIIGDRRALSPLDSVQSESWLPEYTTDLLDLLHVLGRLIALEPAQADLLNCICASPLLGVDELRSAGTFAIVAEKSAPARGGGESEGEQESRAERKKEGRTRRQGREQTQAQEQGQEQGEKEGQEQDQGQSKKKRGGRDLRGQVA